MENINWYPGHMAKTFRILKDKVKLVDLCIIILDARCPLASFSSEIYEVAKSKPVLILFNKSDLSDDKILLKIKADFESKGFNTLSIDCKNNYNISKIKPLIENKILKEKIDKAKSKGINIKPYKIVILGIPNSGKSTLINRLGKKNKVEVKNMPGTTKDISWTRLEDDLLLLDTPGLLWPKLKKDDAIILSIVGTIPDKNLDSNFLAYKLIEYLKINYPNLLLNRYQVDLNNNTEFIINNIGIKKGCFLKGGIIDLEKTSILILKDFRDGLIGKITFTNI